MSKELDEYKVISVPTTLHEMKQHEKEHKALDIIKKKRVDMAILIDSQDLYDYNDYMNSDEIYNEYGNSRQLTQEENELLKEVLGNG